MSPGEEDSCGGTTSGQGKICKCIILCILILLHFKYFLHSSVFIPCTCTRLALRLHSPLRQRNQRNQGFVFFLTLTQVTLVLHGIAQKNPFAQVFVCILPEVVWLYGSSLKRHEWELLKLGSFRFDAHYCDNCLSLTLCESYQLVF